LERGNSKYKEIYLLVYLLVYISISFLQGRKVVFFELLRNDFLGEDWECG
jgi:hypothetical protein